jgi:predicted site-specific integrase-resolvase
MYIAGKSNAHLLSPKEAAERLHIMENTLSVWRSTARYDLPYVKIGRKVFYRESDIETFIASNVIGGAV